MNILKSFFDIVYPRTCAVCGASVDREGRFVCAKCLMRLPFRGSAPEAMSDFESPRFDLAGSALRFEGDARRLVLEYKFRRGLWLRNDFVDWLEGAARGMFDVNAVDCVVGVPWTLLHRIERGYDHVGILARSLAGRIDRPYLKRILYRKGWSQRQSSLGESDRQDNLRGTVGIRNSSRVRGRTVLLVDDILTTGATVSECAGILKGAGAWRVWVLTLARSVRDA